jgi:protein phosphatase
MDCFGLTDVGKVRPSNEDQFLIADLKKSVLIHHTSLSYDDETELHGSSQAKLLLVADGVGGNPGGERASSLAVEGIVQYLLNMMHWLFRLEEAREGAFLEDLKSALAWTQQRIRNAAEASPPHAHMGTTLTLAYVVWPAAYLVHVGDTRAYLYRK